MPPLVSVVIPTYNRAALIVGAIESALGQTWRDLEIIVVDDGSTDNTRAAVAPYLDRVQYIQQEANQGCSVGINEGARRAKGDWLAILDSDDRWAPEKTELQIGVLGKVGRECGLCFTDAVYSGDPGITRTVFQLKGKRFPQESGVIDDAAGYVLDVPNGIYRQTTLVRRDLFTDIGGYDPDLRLGEDTDIHFRLALATKFAYLNRPLVMIDRTPKRRDGLVDLNVSNPHLALSFKQRMYEKWDRLGVDLDESRRRLIRGRLAEIHNGRANIHLAEGGTSEALAALGRAYAVDGNPRWLVKQAVVRFAPSMARRMSGGR